LQVIDPHSDIRQTSSRIGEDDGACRVQAIYGSGIPSGHEEPTLFIENEAVHFSAGMTYNPFPARRLPIPNGVADNIDVGKRLVSGIPDRPFGKNVPLGNFSRVASFETMRSNREDSASIIIKLSFYLKFRASARKDRDTRVVGPDQFGAPF
jgi:hypothetical protein